MQRDAGGHHYSLPVFLDETERAEEVDRIELVLKGEIKMIVNCFLTN